MSVAVRLLRSVQIACDTGCGSESVALIAADSDAGAYVRMREQMSEAGWVVRAGRDYCTDCARIVLDDAEQRVHSYAAAGMTLCGRETGGGVSRMGGYTGPRLAITGRDERVTCPDCRQRIDRQEARP